MRAQRPFDGNNSTISNEDAGLLPRGHSIQLDKLTIRSTDPVNIWRATGYSAIQAGHARPSTGARFHDVYYFHTAFFSEAEILHEALHALLGAGDHVLLATNANLAALGKGGCNLTGHALKDN